jgi:hypothetical protein
MSNARTDREAFEKWSRDVGLCRHFGGEVRFDEGAWAAWQEGQARGQAEPLTDERIYQLWQEATGPVSFVKFARALEREITTPTPKGSDE